eukprot:13357586-Alexandrium_andersonii.AAC.1
MSFGAAFRLSLLVVEYLARSLFVEALPDLSARPYVRKAWAARYFGHVSFACWLIVRLMSW